MKQFPFSQSLCFGTKQKQNPDNSVRLKELILKWRRTWAHQSQDRRWFVCHGRDKLNCSEEEWWDPLMIPDQEHLLCKKWQPLASLSRVYNTLALLVVIGKDTKSQVNQKWEKNHQFLVAEIYFSAHERCQIDSSNHWNPLVNHQTGATSHQMDANQCYQCCLLTQLCQCALTVTKPLHKGKQPYLQAQFLISLLRLGKNDGSDNNDAKHNKNNVSGKGF